MTPEVGYAHEMRMVCRMTLYLVGLVTGAGIAFLICQVAGWWREHREDEEWWAKHGR